jgi:hypothetical protein
MEGVSTPPFSSLPTWTGAGDGRSSSSSSSRLSSYIERDVLTVPRQEIPYFLRAREAVCTSVREEAPLFLERSVWRRL